MSAKTLQNIRDKVRQLTARKSEVQLTTVEIDFQINSYYTSEFPQQLRLLDLRETFTFVTEPNVAVYDFPPDQFQSIEPPVFVAGYTAYFTMDKPQFNALWPQLQIDEQDGEGNGTLGPYTITTQQQPVLQNSLVIAAQTSFNLMTSVQDNGQGQLVDRNGTVSGTVNYQTGQCIFSFFDPVPQGNPIRAQYIKYLASRPNMIFYYSNQLTLFPVPDQAYEVSITTYRIPTELLTQTDTPKFAIQNGVPDQNISEWWEALAYGAAMKIYENNMDLDAMAAMEQLLERKLNLIRRRTWYQMASQRTKTIYAQPTVEAYPGWMYPGLFPGN